MGKGSVLGLCALAVAVPTCDGSEEKSERTDGLELLQRARDKARRAPYRVVVDQEGQRVLEMTPHITAIREGRRVVNWASRGVSYTPRGGRDCYERYTEFNRADVAETRRDAVVPYDVDKATVHMSEGQTVIRWFVRQTFDSAANEGVLRLDREGRPVENRQRSLRRGSIPPSEWSVRRYRYPTRLALPVPGPRCR
jgi:hypothetical protein